MEFEVPDDVDSGTDWSDDVSEEVDSEAEEELRDIEQRLREREAELSEAQERTKMLTKQLAASEKTAAEASEAAGQLEEFLLLPAAPSHRPRPQAAKAGSKAPVSFEDLVSSWSTSFELLPVPPEETKVDENASQREEEEEAMRRARAALGL